MGDGHNFALKRGGLLELSFKKTHKVRVLQGLRLHGEKARNLVTDSRSTVEAATGL